MIHQIIEDKVAQLERKYEFFWATSDGRQVRPCDMDAGHLRNTISFLARRLITLLSQSTWLEPTGRFVEALAHMLHEAKERGIKV